MCAIVGADAVLRGNEPGGPSVPTAWPRLPICAVRPGSAIEVVAVVKAAEAAGVAIIPCGGGSGLGTGYPPDEARHYLMLQTVQLGRILDYQPDDLTVTCEPGVTLAALQQTLRTRRQFLPLDSPLPATSTVAGLVSANRAGFSRPSYGTPRDLLIGLRAVMTGGVEVKGGGKVVKNVAGYDVCKLFTGAWGTLGVLTELTFKVRPMNETEQLLAWDAPDMAIAAELGAKLFRSPVAPAFVLVTNELGGRPALAVGLQGVAARVEWQHAELDGLVGDLGLPAKANTVLPAEADRLRDAQARQSADVRTAVRIVCLPSDLPSLVRSLAQMPDLQVTAQCAVGMLNIASTSHDPSLAAALRSAVPNGAQVRWMRIDPEVAREQQMAIWGETRADFAIQRALKQSLDPKATFSPGRFVCRL